MKSLQISPQEAAIELLSRRKGRSTFANFCRYIAPDEPPAKHHLLICDVGDRIIAGTCKRAMLLMPPGSAKSTYATVRFPPYYLGIFKKKGVICASYNDTLATQFGRKTRNLIKQRETQKLFPGLKLMADSQAKGEWETEDGGFYFSVGIGGGVTGRRADLGIIDDPIRGRKDADSELIRNNQWDWYIEDFRTRLKPGAAILLIQCMTGDTPVLMSDGTEKPLRDIQVGDSVSTFDNGVLGRSMVRKHASNGHDSVFKIRMSCGTIVRANKRHPFLIEDDGVLIWTRVKNLKSGQRIVTLKGDGASGKGKYVKLKIATKKSVAEDSVPSITVNGRGLLVTAHHHFQQIHHRVLTLNSSIVMALRLTNITKYLTRKMGDVLSVLNQHQRQATLSTGSQLFVSIIATKQIKSEDCYAITATSSSNEALLPKYSSPLLSTSDFTTQEIVSIEFDCIEEVFDMQIDRTENFIANGVVSHNTRWHMDDLAGRILPEDWNGESGLITARDGEEWDVISLPAQAKENDILGREIGEWLWTEWFTPQWWEQTKQTVTQMGYRAWNSLYQQVPADEEGTFFKREWFKRFHLGDEPKTNNYQSSDFATKEDEGDYTELGIFGMDGEKELWILDWWYNQTTTDKWIDQQLTQYKEFHCFATFGETGQIRRAVEPFQTMRSRQRFIYPRFEWIVRTGDKPAMSRSFQGMASAGMIHIPYTEWGDRLLNQLCTFPAGRYDDAVDVCALMAMAIQMAHPAIVHLAEETKPSHPGYDWEEEEESSWRTA